MNCYACRIQADRREPAIAFLAGVGFAFEFSNEAMQRRLCKTHQEILVHAVNGSRAVIPPEDRRTTQQTGKGEP